MSEASPKNIEYLFKTAVAKRFVAELPDLIRIRKAYVLPDFSTEGMKGKTEWVHLRVIHNTSNRRTVSRIGNRRFDRFGRIPIQIFAEPGKGPQRLDEISQAVTDMFEGRSLPGFSVVFDNCRPRETGLDNDGRYITALAEVSFRYIVKK